MNLKIGTGIARSPFFNLITLSMKKKRNYQNTYGISIESNDDSELNGLFKTCNSV